MALTFPTALVSKPGVEVHLTVDFSLLSVRIRNNIIHMLETGVDNGGVGSHIVALIFNIEFPVCCCYDTVYINDRWGSFIPEDQLSALESVEALTGVKTIPRSTSRSLGYNVPKNHARNILSLKGIPEWDANVAEALAVVRSGAKVVVCNGKYPVVSPK